MGKRLDVAQLREVTEGERQSIKRLAHSRTAPARTAPAQEPTPCPAGRVRQEIDYGRREKGYIFGAFQPATGDAFTAPYTRRTIANWLDFLTQVDAWLPAESARIYAIRRIGSLL